MLSSKKTKCKQVLRSRLKNMDASASTFVPKISVIIPVYNMEPYIERCISSLRTQTIENIEFIFIDDCGQDGAMAIVERHATEDGRIRILRNARNMGEGPSRNAGMMAARGEYVGTVDPDDWVANNFYELLYSEAVRGNFDIVKGVEYKVSKTKHGTLKARLVLQHRRIARELRYGWALFAVFTSQHTTAIYRRSMLMGADALYGNAKNSPDVVFLLRACHAAQSFVQEKRAEYYYVQRAGSATHRHDRARYDAELASLSEMFDFLSTHESEGIDIYRYAAWMVICYLRRNLEVRRMPKLKEYASEHWREVQRQAGRLANQRLLARFVVLAFFRVIAYIVLDFVHILWAYFHPKNCSDFYSKSFF